MLRKVYLFLSFVIFAHSVYAQNIFQADENIREHIFKYQDISVLEDTGSRFNINQVKSTAFYKLFKANTHYYPKNFNKKSTYWYRIKLRISPSMVDKHGVIEFFDQTTDEIEAYIPDNSGRYTKHNTGDKKKFDDRLYEHKNFEFLVYNKAAGDYTYYFKVRSKYDINVIIVYRTIGYFIGYALSEYLTYGLFYGMILIFCFYNLLMYAAVNRRQYLIYVLYILSVGFYEMSTDGVAFQYLWPDSPHWNEYAYGTALYLVSMFALIFTKDLLQVKERAPRMNKVINWVLVIRTLYFLVCFFVDNTLFTLKFVEFVPLSIAFYTGIRIWKRGFKPARFFVLGYAILFFGFVIKAIHVLGFARIFIPGVLGYYSLGICFILEMVLLSFSIGDQVRVMRKEKDAAHEETIRQMDINNKLKDSINRELEDQVQKRTKEVVEKSKEIFVQADIIERQNHDLLRINKQLEQQAEEISRMNILLEKDNIQLKSDIEKVTDARVLSTEMNFEEFSQKYPDRESCNKFLADLKWVNGYKCIKCGNSNYSEGRSPYSRRCTKCSYEESVLFNTIFENNRIPINKAFYLVYLMYFTKGNISSYQLAEKLNMRQSTCWSYAIKVKKVMDERKAKLKKAGKQGWSHLILEA